MDIKKTVFAVVILSFCILSLGVLTSYAQSNMETRSCGMSTYHSNSGKYHQSFYAKLSKQDKEKYNALIEKHANDTSALHEQLWKDNTKLSVLQNNKNTSPDTLTKLVDDMSDTRMKLVAMERSFQKLLHKEFSDKSSHKNK